MAAAGVEMFNPNEDSGTNAEGFAAAKLAIALGVVDVNELNALGEAAIHGAVHRSSDEIITLLADNGARPDLKNRKGFTPCRSPTARTSSSA